MGLNEPHILIASDLLGPPHYGLYILFYLHNTLFLYENL